MTPGFQNKFRGETIDGLNWAMTEYLYYFTRDGRLLRIKTLTDGPSIPRPGWSLMSPDGLKWLCAVLHDGLYHNGVQVLHNGVWHPFVTIKEECDSFFKEALLIQGVTEGEAEVLYLAVKEFGQPSFDAARKKWPAPPAAEPAEPHWVMVTA